MSLSTAECYILGPSTTRASDRLIYGRSRGRLLMRSVSPARSSSKPTIISSLAAVSSGRAGGRPDSPCRGRPPAAGSRRKRADRPRRARFRAWPAVSRRHRGVWVRCWGPLVELLPPGRNDGDGVMFAFADVQAKENADLADVDHMRHPIRPGRPYPGTDRYIQIPRASRPAKKPVGMPPGTLNRAQT